MGDSTQSHDQYFYPRSPCGERHHGHCAFGHAVDISIHALLAESDGGWGLNTPTPAISIHALLAESDTLLQAIVTHLPISIHALLAESDLTRAAPFSMIWGFLSTLSLRRATHKRPLTGHALAISIHALLAESDASLKRRYPP